MTIQLAAFEAWLRRATNDADVATWRVHGLDLWPLFNTCLSSLAIQLKIAQRKNFVRVGSIAWQLGVILDMAASPFRRIVRLDQSIRLPPDPLEERIVYCGSRVHSRALSDILVTAPLDVPATQMRRAGYDGIFWFEDMEENDRRLRRALNCPARGLARLLATVHARAWQRGLAQDMRRVPGFVPWCQDAATLLRLHPVFLQLWLVRQVALALLSVRCFGKVFDACGHPQLLVLLNGGFASTVGLTKAARERGIPVVEVQHGAISECAAISPTSKPHFSSYNTSPNALITWDLASSSDPRVLAVGPIGLHVPTVVNTPLANEPASYTALRTLLLEQSRALQAHASKVSASHEVLVSLQPRDDGSWVADIAREVGRNILFWVRRHGSDLDRALTTADGTACIETSLATTCALPLLLSRSALHLTRFSAVALEAAAIGMQTLATEQYAETLYGRVISARLLHVEPDLRRAARLLEDLVTANTSELRVTLPDPRSIVPFLETIMAQGLERHAARGRPT